MIELPWSGQPLAGEWLSFDTETTIVDLSTTIPELVVLTASDGQRDVVVFPGMLERFLAAHQDGVHWVGWNTAFDWWAVWKALTPYWGIAPGSGQDPRLEWRDWVTDGRFHDGMLLEQLVRLAEGRDNGSLWNQSLARAAKEYLGREVEKDESVRMNFTPEMARNWRSVDPKFWEYAAKDARVTWDLWNCLESRARASLSLLPVGLFPPGGVEAKFGLLTETLQTKGSLALAQVQRNGFTVDRPKVTEAVKEQEDKANSALTRLLINYPGLVKRYKRTGAVKVTKGSGLPQVNQDYLRAELSKIAEDHGLHPPLADKAKDKDGNAKVKTAMDWWIANAPEAELIQLWEEYQEAAKILQLLRGIEGKDEVHPRYNSLVRTGRTSASGPNIQQVPRDGWYRSLFLARPGHALVTVDYSFIELRTLAEVCEFRYGTSRLAEVIRAGRDPHSHTAALVLKEDYEAVVAGVKAEKKAKEKGKYTNARQAAKAINFGVPGGLGAKKLQGYAKKSYGVDMAAEEAAALRKALVTEVYPELTIWLEDTLRTRLSAAFGCRPEEVDRVFSKTTCEFLPPGDYPEMLMVRGAKKKKDGKPFSPWFLENTWVGLEHLIGPRTPPDIAKAVRDQEPSAWLYDRLLYHPAVTLTGRVRGKVFYSDWRNTQFQGLAADGAKEALWELTAAGFKIVAFIHDEIVVEVKEEVADESLRRVSEIMSTAFRRVFPGNLPVEVEGGISRVWAK